MNANVGGIDRALRIIVGIALLSLLFFVEGNNKYWGLIGLVPLFTGLVRWCPAYSLFGFNTCPMRSKAA